MKKKLLSLIAVSAALVTAGSALVACGGNNDVKTEVTKEQWVSAFSVDSFTSNFKASMKMQEGTDGNGITEEYTLAVGSEKYGDYSLTRVHTRNGVKNSESSEIRIVTTDGDNIYFRYSGLSDDNQWEEDEWGVDNKKHFVYDNDEWEEDVLGEFGYSYFKAFADQYDSFKYSNGAYVLSGDGIVLYENGINGDDYSYSMTITATKATVKFSDNKLTSLEMTMKSESQRKYGDEEVQKGSEEATCTLTVTYGAQTITAPEVPEKDGKAVTQDEWESAIAVAAFRNVTVKSTEKYNGGERINNFKFDYSHNAYYNQSGDSEQVTTYHKDGIDGKQYEKMLGEWQITIDSISLDMDTKIEKMLEEVFLCSYEDFSYDDGVYTALNHHFEGLSEDAFDIIMEFEDGYLVEFEMTSKTDNSAMNYVFSDYGNTTIEVPNVTESPIWNSELNGTYYSYQNGEYNYRSYLTINDGNIISDDGTPCEIEVNGTNITVTFDIGENITQEFIGTIENGVINFTHLKGYENGELIAEEPNASECYRKDESYRG